MVDTFGILTNTLGSALLATLPFVVVALAVFVMEGWKRLRRFHENGVARLRESDRRYTVNAGHRALMEKRHGIRSLV